MSAELKIGSLSNAPIKYDIETCIQLYMFTNKNMQYIQNLKLDYKTRQNFHSELHHINIISDVM